MMKTNSALIACALLLLISCRQAEPETYNQKTLYKKYGIDTVIMSTPDETYYTILDGNGNKKAVLLYSSRQNLIIETLYDNSEHISKIIDYSDNRNHTIRYITINDYQNGKLIRTRQSEDQKTFRVKDEYRYDENGKLIFHMSDGWGEDPDSGEVYSYDSNRVIIDQKDIYGGKRIISSLNKEGKEIERVYYETDYEKNLTAGFKCEREYDMYGNCCRETGYMYPRMQEIDHERTSFYSTKDKLDSVITLRKGHDNKYDSATTYFIYNKQGLLIKELNSEDTTTYMYK